MEDAKNDQCIQYLESQDNLTQVFNKNRRSLGNVCDVDARVCRRHIDKFINGYLVPITRDFGFKIQAIVDENPSKTCIVLTHGRKGIYLIFDQPFVFIDQIVFTPGTGIEAFSTENEFLHKP